jgi:3-isopropylmalate dehydrogenase
MNLSMVLPQTLRDRTSAVDRVLSSGARTPDIARSGDEVIGTKEMGKRICSAMKAI